MLGTLNNCAGGTTPWGTTLSGEENFNQYFANGDRRRRDKPVRRSAPARTERKWERFDKRFDLAQEPNEVAPLRLGRRARPVRPGLHARASTPRSAGSSTRRATVRLTATAAPVVYMGDDERFDYFYKFVSAASG